MTDFTCSGNLNVIENLTVGQPEYFYDNPFKFDNGLVNCTINGRML